MPSIFKTKERKVELPNDILVDSANAVPAQQQDPVAVLLAPLAQNLTPADAITVATDFGPQVQQIRAEEAAKIMSSQERLQSVTRAFESVQQGINLSSVAAEELARLEDNQGPIDFLFNLVKRGPKKAFQDELGISESRAKKQLRLGNSIIASAKSRLDYETFVATEESAIRESLLSVGARTVDAAKDIVTIQSDQERLANEQTRLRLSEREARQAEARLNFDIADKRSRQSKEAVENLIASASSADVSQLHQQLVATGQEFFTYTDPIQNVTVNVPTGFLGQAAEKKKLEEAQFQASIALAAVNQVDAMQTLDKNILKGFSTSQLRQILASEGQSSIKDPTTGEPIVKTFDVLAVSEALTIKEKLIPLQDAALGALDNQARIAKIQALGPGATAEQILEIPLDPQTEQVLGALESVDSSFTRIRATVPNLFLSPEGTLPLNVQSLVDDLATDSAEMNQLRTNILLGRVGLTPEVTKQLDTARRDYAAKIQEGAKSLAATFAGGDKALESFVTNSILGGVSTPEVAAKAFMSLALQPEAGPNLQSSVATRKSMERFNRERLNLYNKALAEKNVVSTAASNDALGRLLSQMESSKSGPKLSQEERDQLDLQALNAASNSMRNGVRDAILGGDLSVLAPKHAKELAKHPFMSVKLGQIRQTAEQALARAAEQQGKKLTDPELASVYHLEYAKALADTPINDDNFESALDAYNDFLTQPALTLAIDELARGQSVGNLGDQVSTQLLGRRAAHGLFSDLQNVKLTGDNVQANVAATRQKVRQSYGNNGITRLDMILQAMGPEIIADQDRRTLKQAVQNEILRTGGGRLPRTNDIVTRFVLHHQFQDPQVESIRKRVAKEWTSTASIVDRSFFIQGQEPQE